MRIPKPLILTLIGFFFIQASWAQTPRFLKQIQAFKAQDKEQAPPENPILLIGSSSFTIWTDVDEYFPDKTILNRGFGGSVIPDLILFAQDVIVPYQPKQILIYCGDNDIAAGASPEMVLDRYKILESIIQYELGNVPIAYVAIKPSISRSKFLPQIKKANHLIKTYIEDQDNQDVFIDVFNPMLDADGNPLEDVFLKDQLHMNEKGYRIWQTVIKPYLL